MKTRKSTLKLINATEHSTVYAGTLADCRRKAFSVGLEIGRYEGAILSSDNGKAIYAPADQSNFTCCHFKQGGFIMKARDDYTLVVRN